MLKPDYEQITGELKMFQGGVVDTCTLIYLERTNLLVAAGRSFRLLVPPDVVQEFGHPLPGCVTCTGTCTGDADRAVMQTAIELQLPVLSEDRQLLMSSHRLGLKYYNTLMILLALLFQQKISLEEYQQSYSSLREIARYSTAVWQMGVQVFSLYVR